MSCKYCKKGAHLIDNCPEIICKKCRTVGHPFWKCKNISKHNVDKSVSPPPIHVTQTHVTTPAVGIFNRNIATKENKEHDIQKDKEKDSYADALCNADNKIAYYMKYQGVRWNLMI